MSTPSGVREVARRAVHDQIVAAAEDLFREQGYDATTVDDIAARVGMSQRTFFRHAGSKEDVALEGQVRLLEEMVRILAERPAEEHPWVSLRRCLEVVVEQHRDPAAWERTRLTWSAIEASPSLRAAYLERMQGAQRRMADLLHGDAGGGLRPSVTRAVVGAAFAALGAAVERCLPPEGGDDFGGELDHVMAQLEPRCLRGWRAGSA